MLYITIWNVAVALLFGFDKLMAKNKGKRVREDYLIFVAFLMGGLGALLGMVIFNHKTSKTKFRALIPLAFLFNIAVIYILTNKI